MQIPGLCPCPDPHPMLCPYLGPGSSSCNVLQMKLQRHALLDPLRLLEVFTANPKCAPCRCGQFPLGILFPGNSTLWSLTWLTWALAFSLASLQGPTGAEKPGRQVWGTERHRGQAQSQKGGPPRSPSGKTHLSVVPAQGR